MDKGGPVSKVMGGRGSRGNIANMINRILFGLAHGSQLLVSVHAEFPAFSRAFAPKMHRTVELDIRTGIRCSVSCSELQRIDCCSWISSGILSVANLAESKGRRTAIAAHCTELRHLKLLQPCSSPPFVL